MVYSNFYLNLFTFSGSPALGIYLAVVVFFLGVVGFYWRVSSLLVALVFAELMFVSMFVGVVSTALFIGDSAGLLYSLYLLCTAAADSSIGLILTLNAFRLAHSVSFGHLSAMRT